MKREPVRQDGLARVDAHGIARNEMFTTYVNLLSVQMFDHGYFQGDLSWNRTGVSSPFGRLYYMIGDAGWLDTEQGRVDLLPGRMYLIPPHTRVDLRTDRRIEKFYLHFSASFAGFDLFEGVSRCLELPLPPEHLQDLLRSFRGNDVADILLFQSVVHDTVSRFVRNYLPDVGHRLVLASKYRDLHAYVDAHLDANLTAATVAAALGLPHAAWARRYRKDTGITLNQYIHGQIVQRAARLLLLTPMGVREVAEALGFSDEFYFSRFFKKEMEYSPREYRRVGGFHGSTASPASP
jgi:AraC-like DNA-binding protein